MDKLTAVKAKLKSPVVRNLALCSTGAVVGAAAHFLHFKKTEGPYALLLGKEAFEALVNDETNFVRFTSNLHEHVFRVTVEH